jgi:hypothetical protein
MNNKFYIEKTGFINSQPEYIFKVLTEVKNWNQWTKSIIDISLQDTDKLKVGAKIKVRQPKLLPAVWIVTEFSKNKFLAWEKKSIGLKMIANHIIQGYDDGAIVKLQIIYQGFLAAFFYKLTYALTEKYMTMELSGLKNKCESNSQ